MSSVRLYVGGRIYQGWTSVRVSLSIESISGSFDMSIVDRWSGQNEPWPIQDEDECRLVIDDETVIQGWVDRRGRGFDGLGVGGRDKPGALVDCTTLVGSFASATIPEIITKIAAQFGVAVSVQPGITFPAAKKFVVNPGETAYTAIERAARMAGVLVVSDYRGGIIITRSGSGRAEPLEQGRNILPGASWDTDMTGRFHRYVCLTQAPGSDDVHGDAARIRHEVIDQEVKRTDRVYIVRPETGTNLDYARRRTEWEAKTRAANSQVLSIPVRGWRQKPGGALWKPNLLTHVTAPRLGGEAGDLLISQVDLQLDDRGGETAQLRLVRPDAYDPEPVVKRSGGGAWAELRGGV